ncbi:hypothetical protein BDV06DRAFT_229347 [Aspergillus oleicola]
MGVYSSNGRNQGHLGGEPVLPTYLPSQFHDNSASIPAPPTFIHHTRMLPPPPRLYQHPYGALALPRHEPSQFTNTPRTTALGPPTSVPSPSITASLLSTSYSDPIKGQSTPTMLPLMQETPVTTYNTFQCRKAPRSAASIQAPLSLPSIGEALAVQYEAPFNNSLQASGTPSPTSYDTNFIPFTGFRPIMSSQIFNFYSRRKSTAKKYTVV